MPQCMDVHHVCTWTQGGQKVRTIELELQTSEITARAPNLWALCADFPASPSPHPETFFFCFFFEWGNNVSISSSWPWTHDPHTLTSHVLVYRHKPAIMILQTYRTIPLDIFQAPHLNVFTSDSFSSSRSVSPRMFPNPVKGMAIYSSGHLCSGTLRSNLSFRDSREGCPELGKAVLLTGVASRECSHSSHASWLQGQGEDTPAVPAFLPWGTGPDHGNREQTRPSFSCFLPGVPHRKKKSSCYRDAQWTWHMGGQKWNKISPLLVRAHC